MNKRISPIGELIQEYMRQLGLRTQKELADLSGVSQSTISRIILGDDDDPGIRTLEHLALGLGVSVVALLPSQQRHLLPTRAFLKEKYLINDIDAEYIEDFIEAFLSIRQRREARAG